MVEYNRSCDDGEMISILCPRAEVIEKMLKWWLQSAKNSNNTRKNRHISRIQGPFWLFQAQEICVGMIVSFRLLGNGP